MHARRTASTRSLAMVLVCSIAVGFGLARCGAQDAEAPLEPVVTTTNACGSLEQTMPNFYKLLRDPSQPLAGIRQVVDSVASGQTGQLQGNSLLRLLSTALQGLTHFAQDPMENGGACIVVTDAVAPPSAPLCTLNTATPCENRICALRRALDFGVRDQAAVKALNDLEPLLAKIVGYISNVGPGADGHDHYEVINVFHKMALDESSCSPANLLDVLDGVMVYFRASRDNCGGKGCPGLQLLDDIQAILNDPALQSFLASYQNSQSDGSGRASFQALATLLEPAFQNMPNDSTYFDQIQKIADTVISFMQNDSSHKYDALIPKIQDVVAITKQLLDPSRPGAFSKQLKAVVGCIAATDKDQQIVGGLYDLLSKPGGTNGMGLDLVDVVDSVGALAHLDRDGVLAGALHAVLASTRASPQSMETVRQFLVEFITEQNARELLPPVQAMITDGVVNEFLTEMDELVYGCQLNGSP